MTQNPIFLQNSLSGKKEEFKPLKEGKVQIYSCGPTVYDFAHIGNFRSFLMADILVRVFQLNKYEVTKIMNITDVGHLTNDDHADADGEDKISKKAKAENLNPFDIAQKFEKFFIEDEKVLNILPPQKRPRATDFIVEQLDIVKDLIQKDFAYKINGSVYFRTKKFEDYGKLSKNNLEKLNAGARVEVNSEKEDPLDFALWKKADSNHLMQWDYESGTLISLEDIKTQNIKNIPEENRGFPGWHIECSAMSKALLGEHFDIHTGGEDNMFPHHECEIAQNEASCGHKSVNYWLHGKHLLVEGKKMSKSKGNFYTIKDLIEKGWKGNEIRLALISSHYRNALNFSEKSLEQARNSIRRINETVRILEKFLDLNNSSLGSRNTQELEPGLKIISKNFIKTLNDDLNIPEALSFAFEVITTVLQNKEKNILTEVEAQEVLNFLKEDFNSIFAILEDNKIEISEEIATLLQKRKKARESKDWAKSDEIRDQIKDLGFEILDAKGEQELKKI